MPVSPVCMVDVVLLTRNFLLLHFSFFPLFRLHASDVTLSLLSRFICNQNFSRQIIMTSAPS